MIIPCTSDKSEPISLGDPWPCLRCGYDLRGATESETVRCPECGLVHLRSLREHPDLAEARRLGRVITLGLLGGVGWAQIALGILLTRSVLITLAIPLLLGGFVIATQSFTQFRQWVASRGNWLSAYLALVAIGTVASMIAVACAGLGVGLVLAVARSFGAGQHSSLLELVMGLLAIACLVLSILLPYRALARRMLGPAWPRSD